MKPGIKIDTREFQSALREYMARSKRGLADVLNQRGFSACLAATKMTQKAEKAKIREELLASGRTGAPAAAAIINSALKRGGTFGERVAKIVKKPVGKGLRGEDLQTAVDLFIRRRAQSSAYLRSGWLAGVAVFANAIGKSPSKNAARALSLRKFVGDASKAMPGISPAAKFWNTAFSPNDTPPNDGVSLAQAGLQAALNQEASRMREHVARRAQKDADAIARKFLR